jgi:EAL domain-containing protein (putative c-di-GMP-specific phosphodiesterase class I)
MTTEQLLRAGSGVLEDACIVVIDDLPANVLLLTRLLRGAGVLRVHGITDSREALETVSSLNPDLVLLDLHMPHLDGVAVLEALHAQLPEGEFLPVAILTADISGESRERALSAGAKDFLTKPFDRAEVILRVRNLLETRALYGRVREHSSRLEAELEEQKQAERARAARDQERTERVRIALKPEAMRMVFQPIVTLDSGKVVGVEALARFACPPPRPPDEWFAEAALDGRGVELELAAIAAGLGRLGSFPPESFMSVNCSPDTAMHPELGALLRGFPASRIVLELTEHDKVGDYGELDEALRPLRERGVRIALDDTGAGYAGLQHILRLRPDLLKLDIALTRGIDTDAAKRSLAAALVGFAHEIGATIIAEGIETAAELTVLNALGIGLGQGYHLGRPAALAVPAVSRRESSAVLVGTPGG